MTMRPGQSDPPNTERPGDPAPGGGGNRVPPLHHPGRENPRLNLLLSLAAWRQGTALDQLPSLLAPLGIQSIKTTSGEEAAEVIQRFTVHIAVVDLAIPLERESESTTKPPSTEAGPRLLQLLRRLEAPPPTVVVRPPQPESRQSARGLREALSEGAFAVLDQPVNLESLLEVLRRILRRHYADGWPR